MEGAARAARDPRICGGGHRRRDRRRSARGRGGDSRSAALRAPGRTTVLRDCVGRDDRPRARRGTWRPQSGIRARGAVRHRFSAGRSAVALASAGTDGIDGPTDAAGAIVDVTTSARARRAVWTPRRRSRPTAPTIFSSRSAISSNGAGRVRTSEIFTCCWCVGDASVAMGYTISHAHPDRQSHPVGVRGDARRSWIWFCVGGVRPRGASHLSRRGEAAARSGGSTRPDPGRAGESYNNNFGDASRHFEDSKAPLRRMKARFAGGWQPRCSRGHRRRARHMEEAQRLTAKLDPAANNKATEALDAIKLAASR